MWHVLERRKMHSVCWCGKLRASGKSGTLNVYRWIILNGFKNKNA
jgi:hypothetical protein